MESWSDRQKGLASACLGVLLLSPDTLLIRLSTPPCPENEMMFWRFFLAILSLLALTTANTYQDMCHNRAVAAESEKGEARASEEDDTNINIAVTDTNTVTATLFREVYTKFTSMNRYMLLAGVIYGLGNLFFLWAVSFTYVASALVVMATASFWASLLSFFLLGEKMEMHTMVCCFTCIAAIVLIFSASSDEDGDEDDFQPTESEHIFGLLCALGVAITSACYYTVMRVVMVKNRQSQSAADGGVRENIDLIPVNVLSCFLVMCVSLTLKDNGITRGESFMLTGDTSTLYLFLQGCLCIPLSFTLLANASGRIRSAEIGMIMTFETVMGPVWVQLAGYEAPPSFTLYGGIIIVTALLTHEYVNLQRDTPQTYLQQTTVDNRTNVPSQSDTDTGIIATAAAAATICSSVDDDYGTGNEQPL